MLGSGRRKLLTVAENPVGSASGDTVTVSANWVEAGSGRTKPRSA
jgi:hypothetical protein